MITAILIQNFRNYKGSNKIRLNPNLPLTAVIGPNGSGKSTILNALAIASGRSDFEIGDTESVIGVTVRDGTNFRRCASGGCMVGDEEVSLQEYKEAAAKTLRLFVTNSDFPWQTALGDPEKLLEYIEDLELPHTGSRTASEPVAQSFGSLYKTRVEVDKHCYERYKRASRKLNRIKKELSKLQGYQEVQQHLIDARSSCQEYRKSLALYKMAKLQVRIESIQANCRRDNAELQETSALLAEDLEKLDEASAALKTLEERIASYPQTISEVKSRIQREKSESLRLHLTLYWRSECVKIEKEVWESYECDIVILVDILRKALEMLDVLSTRSDFFWCLKDVVKQSGFALKRAALAYLHGRGKLKKRYKYIINNMTETRSSLQDEEICMRSCMSKIEIEKQKKEELNVPPISKEPRTKTRKLESSEFNSLKLLYPGILGTLEDFVMAREDVESTPKDAIESIIRGIADSRKEIMMVVDSDDRAIEYATTISTYENRQMNFVPRKIPDICLRTESVPSQIAKDYPSACCLSSLLVTSTREEEHLKYCLADRYLVLPSREACAQVAKRCSWGLCCSDGTHYRLPKDFAAEASTFCIVVGEDEDEDEDEEKENHRLAKRREQAQLVEEEIARLEEQVGYTEMRIIHCNALLSQYPVAAHMLEQLYTQVFEGNAKVRQEVEELRNIWQEMRKVQNSNEALRALWKEWSTDKLKQWLLLLERHKSKRLPDPCLINWPNEEEAYNLISSCKDNLKTATSHRDEHKLSIEELTHRREKLASRCEDLKLRIRRAEQLSENCMKKLDDMMRADGSLLAPSVSGDSEYDEESLRQKIEKILEPFDRSNEIWTIEAQIKARIEELQDKISDCEKKASHIIDDEPLRIRIQSSLEDYEKSKKELQESAKSYKTANDALARLKEERNSRVLQNMSRLDPVFERVYYEMYDHIGRSSAQGNLNCLSSSDVSQGISIRAIPAGKPYCPVSHLSSGEKAIVWLSLQIAIGIVSGCNTITIDEVDAHLDSQAALGMARSLLRITQASNLNLSIILVTHRRAVYIYATQYMAVIRDPRGSRVLSCPNRPIARR